MKKYMLFIAILLCGTASADTLKLYHGNQLDTHDGVIIDYKQQLAIGRVDFGSLGYTNEAVKPGTQPGPGIGYFSVFVNGMSWTTCEQISYDNRAQREAVITMVCSP